MNGAAWRRGNEVHHIMAHLSASKLTFTSKWDDMSDDERTAEQVAAFEIVAKCGGSIKSQYLLVTDGCLLCPSLSIPMRKQR